MTTLNLRTLLHKMAEWQKLTLLEETKKVQYQNETWVLAGITDNDSVMLAANERKQSMISVPSNLVTITFDDNTRYYDEFRPNRYPLW